ncbi:hypothetical protein RBSWK_05896 [Rhodopirellula baltica SWK14]|uniref:Uncharacterized protein n=1 Tax=Rhodopirellula baltica SWK14 TaxID=993516 RepID=L7C7Y8_RHOBT|nr:hypothetical protein RBSWK_05896 [Rhodopirellula baltica SWK14]
MTKDKLPCLLHFISERINLRCCRSVLLKDITTAQNPKPPS